MVGAAFPFAGMCSNMSLPPSVSCGMVLAFQQVVFGALGPLIIVYCQVVPQHAR